MKLERYQGRPSRALQPILVIKDPFKLGTMKNIKQFFAGEQQVSIFLKNILTSGREWNGDGRLCGLVIERLPLAQVMIPGPGIESHRSLLPRLCLCLSLMNK